VFAPEIDPERPSKTLHEPGLCCTVEISDPSLPPKGHPVMASLTRPRSNRMIAGVCAGLARRFGLRPNVVRLIFVVSMLLPGPQILIYLAAWILIPAESDTLV
jgi:phage shock protein PspC (stress-responsive transcriptional regulator)